jgi:hypothetical protein
MKELQKKNNNFQEVNLKLSALMAGQTVGLMRWPIPPSVGKSL